MKSMVLVLVSCLVVSAFGADLYENVAFHKPATQSNNASQALHAIASRANDGNRTNVESMDHNSCIHTAYDVNNTEAWWTVDLEYISRIHELLITYRNWGTWPDQSSAGRLVGFSIFVSNTSDFKNGTVCFQQNGSKPDVNRTSYPCSAIGRFVTVYNNRTDRPFPYGYSGEAVLELCEVEIPGCRFQYFGQDCNNSCFCKEVTCDYKTGQCYGTCQPGYVGELCNKACDPGRYGDNCSFSCPNCGGNKTCNQSGVCLDGCKDGYITDQSSGCPKQCGKCEGIQCNADGSCPRNCVNGYYMSDCTKKCSAHCYNKTCEQTSGTCTPCIDGYFGEYCNKKCPNYCLQGKCDNTTGYCLEKTSQVTLPIAVGTASGVLFIILVILMIVILYRKKRRNSAKRSHIYLHSAGEHPTEHIYTNTQPGNQIVQASLNDESVTFHHGATINEAKSKNRTTQKTETKPQQTASATAVYNNTSEEINGIRTDEFQKYVNFKQKQNQLEIEYKGITHGAQYPHVEAEKPENMPKNRFKKTFPYDHSRVILSSHRGRKTDYINANYIDGYNAKMQYIATQGPLSNTIGDFWRMTWESKADKIVMVTNLQELNKVKCEQYWPDPNKPIQHDGFEITCLDEREFLYYAIRNLRIENKKTKERRKVWQFHFTTWPDHGTPDPLLLVLFHRRFMNTKAELNGPIIVHCSAGIGRTGTFIGLDALLKQGQDTGRVDVKRYVEIMRKDRMNMIQTAQQYECLHEALAEGLQTQDTVIMMNGFTAEWRKSQCDTGPTNQRRLRKEYNILVSLKKTDNQEDYKTALLTVNKMKNRNPAIIASDRYRPFLNYNGGERTDYINAVILPTHTKRNGYIVTQRPLSNTVLDFWQMIEEHQISKIVLFEDESDEKTMFYPGAREMDIDIGMLKYRKETDYSDDVTMIELVIAYNCATDDRKVTVIKVKTCGRQLPNARQILKVNEIVTSEEPCCVISQDGTSPCDIYCTVTNLQESMKIDNEIDVFQTARQLQLRRPEFFGKYESYELCFGIINEHLTNDSVYFNS